MLKIVEDIINGKQCPKCSGLRVGNIPVYSTDPEPISAGVMDGGGFAWLRSKGRQGQLEAYVCADCGYFETYVKDPKMLNFAEIERFRWVNPAVESEGPYR